jgi:hypothetical protein
MDVLYFCVMHSIQARQHGIYQMIQVRKEERMMDTLIRLHTRFPQYRFYFQKKDGVWFLSIDDN